MLSENFKYKGLMKYFEEISAIPRASYKEKEIADYLCDFAQKRGYEYYRDSANNVLINAPATEGYEDAAALLLQGHTDMVCEKNEGVEHDFDKDPLELYEEDGWIKARGTTLGADDGVAVAIMLYVLDGGVSGHGRLQCLFTASEEVGLDGVKAFDYGKIFARQMINMDSADEKHIIAGCAGGQRSCLTYDGIWSDINANYVAKITIKGLMGGHSGEDIDKGRANANKLMGRLLSRVVGDEKLNARIVDIHGGSKDNAIPRECRATVAVTNIDILRELCDTEAKALYDGLSAYDSACGVEVELVAENQTVKALDQDTANRFISLILCAHVGIFDMNHNIEGLVEWSRNLGVVSCGVKEIKAVFSSRSSFESRIDASERELDALAALTGARTKHYNRYPGWSFTENSVIRQRYVNACSKVIGCEPRVDTIHAGLECGFISQAVPDMDIVSCGAIVRDLHSPDEKLDKASFERFFTIIKTVVEERP